MAEDSTFDLDAAGLRADGPQLLAAVEVLARKLEISLPRSCVVQPSTCATTSPTRPTTFRRTIPISRRS